MGEVQGSAVSAKTGNGFFPHVSVIGGEVTVSEHARRTVEVLGFHLLKLTFWRIDEQARNVGNTTILTTQDRSLVDVCSFLKVPDLTQVTEVMRSRGFQLAEVTIEERLGGVLSQEDGCLEGRRKIRNGREIFEENSGNETRGNHLYPIWQSLKRKYS